MSDFYVCKGGGPGYQINVFWKMFQMYKSNVLIMFCFFLSFLKITCSHHHGKTAYVQSTLDSHHAYFLLADNGTEGEYGAEVIFRRRIERHLYQQKVSKGR